MSNAVMKMLNSLKHMRAACTKVMGPQAVEWARLGYLKEKETRSGSALRIVVAKREIARLYKENNPDLLRETVGSVDGPMAVSTLMGCLTIDQAFQESKAVFVFDDDIVESLTAKPVGVVDEVFLCIPQVIQFLSLESLGLVVTLGDQKHEIPGVFVHLQESDQSVDLVLSYVLDKVPVFFQTIVPLNGDPVVDPIYKALVDKTLPLILYLCSEKADVRKKKLPQVGGTKRKKKNPKRTKREKAKPVIYEVAFRLGSQLREQTKAPHKGGTVRPHVRRGHWRASWTGPRKIASERKRIIKWIMPAIVGGTVEDLSPTRYHVSGSSR